MLSFLAGGGGIPHSAAEDLRGPTNPPRHTVYLCTTPPPQSYVLASQTRLVTEVREAWSHCNVAPDDSRPGAH